jgi:WD40 repeat protein
MCDLGRSKETKLRPIPSPAYTYEDGNKPSDKAYRFSFFNRQRKLAVLMYPGNRLWVMDDQFRREREIKIDDELLHVSIAPDDNSFLLRGRHGMYLSRSGRIFRFPIKKASDYLGVCSDSSTVVLAGTTDIKQVKCSMPTKVTDVVTGRKADYHGVSAVCISPDHRYFAIGGFNYLEVWDTEKWRLLKKIVGKWNITGGGVREGDWVNSVAFSSDGKLLAATGSLSTVMLNTANWKQADHLKGLLSCGAYQVDFVKPDKLILLNPSDISEYSTVTGKLVGRVDVEGIVDMHVSPFDGTVATSDIAGRIFTWSGF